MNWHNLSDKEFEGELKRHLEKTSIPYDPDSWVKMDKKLDLHFSSDNTGNGSLLSLLIIMALLSAVFFYNLTTLQGVNTTDHQIADYRSTLSDEIPPKTTPLVDKNSNLLNPIDDESAAKPVKPKTQGKDSKEQVPVSLSSSGKPDKSSVDLPLAATRNLRESIQQGTTGASAANSNSDPGIGDASRSIYSRSDISGISGNKPSIDDPSPVMFPASIAEVALISSATPPVIKNANGARWFLGVSYAPDISLVGFGETTSPGTNLAIDLEYRLGSRWGIQTGLIYSMKKYKAAGDDYSPPEGFWDYGKIPEEMDAECNVIDIPINLRYYFNSASKHRFFAGTGLSSYLMLTEDYYYEYDYYNPDLVDSWSIKNENQHFFSVYNFSAGYQRTIGNRLFLEIEPFLKIPLSGIGFGEVDLWSTGSRFTLKYSFR